MRIQPSQTVGQIAVMLKEAIPIFEKHKINYYNQGHRSLKDACWLAGVPIEEVLQELEEAGPTLQEWYATEPNWRQEPIAELTDFILKNHHVFARHQLNLIERLFEELVEGPTPPQEPLPLLHDFFQNMARDFRDHMREEEEVVFPYLVEVERALERGLPIPRPFRDHNALTHPIRILQEDHGMMGREWMKIEEMTNGFTAPSGAPKAMQDLYQAFRELEEDNRRHIHLENNVLFHRAMQLGLLNNEEKNGNPAVGGKGG